MILWFCWLACGSVSSSVQCAFRCLRLSGLQHVHFGLRLFGLRGLALPRPSLDSGCQIGGSGFSVPVRKATCNALQYRSSDNRWPSDRHQPHPTVTSGDALATVATVPLPACLACLCMLGLFCLQFISFPSRINPVAPKKKNSSISLPWSSHGYDALATSFSQPWHMRAAAIAELVRGPQVEQKSETVCPGQ